MKTTREMAGEEIGVWFGRFAGEQSRGDARAVEEAARQLCGAVARGAVCVELRALESPGEKRSPEAWRDALLGSGFVGVPDAGLPLVLDGSRLYLRRQWEEERDLAAALLSRCPEEVLPQGEGGSAGRAAALAERSRLVILCGGPGTGKTTLAGSLLASGIGVGRIDPRRVALAAPTGRAARRLGESLAAALAGGGGETPQAKTLHALLGVFPHESRPRHHRGNPIPADFVVVDEGSMVSLSMMGQLLGALRQDARLLLLGDPGQLASVDAGAVLGDLARAARVPGSALGRALVTLDKNYRFGEGSGIHRLASAVRAGDAEAAVGCLENGGEDLRWRPLPGPSGLGEALREIARESYGALAACGSPAEALARLGAFRVLSPLRAGPFGVVRINALLASLLAGGRSGEGVFAPGTPLLVTRNDPGRGLFNGDTGIVLRAGGAGGAAAWFEGESGSPRGYPLPGLPPHEMAYATTVHKAQGSEYDRVLILLPEEAGRLLTREMLYTALTRARGRADLWCSREALASAVGNPTERVSGLLGALGGGG